MPKTPSKGLPNRNTVSAVAPLFAGGCYLPSLIRLLVRHHFRVHVKCWPALAVALVLSAVQSGLGSVQTLVHRRRVARTPLRGGPIFILGHWRTGTKLLHYFLALDERHIGPTTYECFAPNHFLLTERWMMKFLRSLRSLPPDRRRAQDNVRIRLDRPQEDEIALLLLGQPSPYVSALNFPNDPPVEEDYFDLENVPPPARTVWQQALVRFFKQVTLLHGRRIVSKSPLHSARIKFLLETFPEARFVHIVRDPFVVFPSTMHKCRALIRMYSWQKPTFAGLEEKVFETGLALYERLEAGKKLIPAGHFHELRYEDLVGDPVGQLRTLYEQLDLCGFDRFQPRLEAYLARTTGYQTNRYELSPELRAEIARRWAPVIQRYGYAPARGDRSPGWP